MELWCIRLRSRTHKHPARPAWVRASGFGQVVKPIGDFRKPLITRRARHSRVHGEMVIDHCRHPGGEVEPCHPGRHGQFAISHRLGRGFPLRRMPIKPPTFRECMSRICVGSGSLQHSHGLFSLGRRAIWPRLARRHCCLLIIPPRNGWDASRREPRAIRSATGSSCLAHSPAEIPPSQAAARVRAAIRTGRTAARDFPKPPSMFDFVSRTRLCEILRRGGFFAACILPVVLIERIRPASLHPFAHLSNP